MFLFTVCFLVFPHHPVQALPYVALLIAMLFFIYAVIGMQVFRSWAPADFALRNCSSAELKLRVTSRRCLGRSPWWTGRKSTATTTSRPSRRPSSCSSGAVLRFGISPFVFVFVLISFFFFEVLKFRHTCLIEWSCLRVSDVQCCWDYSMK